MSRRKAIEERLYGVACIFWIGWGVWLIVLAGTNPEHGPDHSSRGWVVAGSILGAALVVLGVAALFSKPKEAERREDVPTGSGATDG